MIILQCYSKENPVSQILVHNCKLFKKKKKKLNFDLIISDSISV